MANKDSTFDNSQYLDIFIEESRENLQVLNEKLLALEGNWQDMGLLGEIFRAAHTLKGMSATMGFGPLAELTHKIENLLDQIRKGTATLDSSLSDALFSAFDFMEKMVGQIAATGSCEGIDAQEVLERLAGGKGVPAPQADQAATATASAPEITAVVPPTPATSEILHIPPLETYELNVLHEAVKKGFKPFWLQVTLQEGCMLKGVRTYMVMTALEPYGEAIKTVPSVKDLEEEKFDRTFAVLLVTRADPQEIQSKLSDISEIALVTVSQAQLTGPKAEKDEAQARKGPAAKAPTRSEPKAESKGEEDKGARTGQTVRVSTEKLDHLVNLVGELVIDRTRLVSVGSALNNTQLAEVVRHLGNVIADLQGVAMKLRMVPVERVFNRFPRMVRDLSKELGKEVQLIIEGEDTELDKLVIDEIGDPLVHLLRNSLDHGLELPDERARDGKPLMGTILLRAGYEGNHVVIEVADDGKGIDPGRLRRKAVQNALMSEEEADRLSDQQAIELIFHQGFSTAEQVTDISGRGVGMDAVQRKVETLGGTIEVKSQVGAGTLTTITLPLTLAIVQAMLIEVGGEIYAIPLNTIEEAVDLQDNPVKEVLGTEVLLLRGQTLPLIRLSRVLETEDTSEAQHVVVCRVGAKLGGLVVDSLLDQQEIVIKPISKLIGNIRHISGASTLGNGRLALILDVATLI